MNIFMLLTPKKNVTFLTTKLMISEALDILKIVRFSSVPLLDEEGRYVGSLTEGDLLWYLEEQGYEKSLSVYLSQVKRFRDYKPVSINAKLDDLVSKSLNQNFMPILDDRGFFIGIVTRSDILNHFLAGIDLRVNQPPRNEVVSNLYKRRSIRKFKSEKIEEHIIEEILDSALVSPTAANRQGNHVFYINDTSLIKEVSKIHVRGGQFAQVEHLLLVLNDDTKEGNKINALSNVSALTMSLLLAISSYEHLGGYWIAARDEGNNREICDYLGVSPSYSLHAMIAFGVKEEIKGENTISEKNRIHINKW